LPLAQVVCHPTPPTSQPRPQRPLRPFESTPRAATSGEESLLFSIRHSICDPRFLFLRRDEEPFLSSSLCFYSILLVSLFLFRRGHFASSTLKVSIPAVNSIYFTDLLPYPDQRAALPSLFLRFDKSRVSVPHLSFWFVPWGSANLAFL